MAKAKKPPFVVVVQTKNTNHVIGVIGLFATQDMALRWIDENAVLTGPGGCDYHIAELMPGG